MGIGNLNSMVRSFGGQDKILSVDGALNRVKDIASLACSSTDAKKAGSGRIGIFNGHVIKFHTTFFNRVFRLCWGEEMKQMQQSCNDLRKELFFLSQTLLAGQPKGLALLADIAKKLGVKYDAETGDVTVLKSASKKLLDRSVVLSSIETLKSGLEEKQSSSLNNISGVKSSSDTKFKTIAGALLKQNGPASGSREAMMNDCLLFLRPPNRAVNASELQDPKFVRSLEDSARLLSGTKDLFIRHGYCLDVKPNPNAPKDEDVKDYRDAMAGAMPGAKPNGAYFFVGEDSFSKTITAKLKKGVVKKGVDKNPLMCVAHKLYVTITPGDLAKLAKKKANSDFATKLKAAFETRDEGESFCCFKYTADKMVLSNLRDHVCGYFLSKDSMNRSVEKLKKLSEEFDLNLEFSVGRDVVSDGAPGISHTMILTARKWVQLYDSNPGILDSALNKKTLKDTYDKIVRFLKEFDSKPLHGDCADMALDSKTVIEFRNAYVNLTYPANMAKKLQIELSS